MKTTEIAAIPQELIQQKIYFIRGEKVMFDRDLAALYGVETFNLNKAVKRNIDRFPKDFMFQLNKKEIDSLRFQFGILKRGEHAKYLPHVFTEQGVAMLSSVLNSKRAIQVNIQIIRTFTQLRKILATHKELREKIETVEKRIQSGEKKNDKYFKAIFNTLRLLMREEEKPKVKIGFAASKN